VIAPTFSPADIPAELVVDVLHGWFSIESQELRARLAIAAGIELVTPVAEITPKVAGEVLWAYGHSVWVKPSDYRLQLIGVIGKADPSNRRRLALAEPAYVAAVQLIQFSPDGVATLTTIAKAGERHG